MAGEDKLVPPGEKKPYDPKAELDAIMEKALSARGFVLFAAVLQEEKDSDGNRKIEFIYTRHKYTFEDLTKAVMAFREQATRDVLGSFK
jgi:hypothetical protein